MPKPDWFEAMMRKAVGRDLDKFRLLDNLFQEPQAIRQDLFDRRKFDEILRQANELTEVVTGRAPDYPTWEDLIQDTYLSLWKANPRLRDRQEMRPSHVINWTTMEKVLSTSDIEELRTWTRLDDWAAAMGTVSIAVKLAQFLDEQKDLSDLAKAAAEKEQELLEQLQQARHDLMEDASIDQINDFLDDLEQALAEYAEAIEDLDNAADANQYQIRQAVQDGMDDALESTEDIISLVQNFGTDPGQWERLDSRMRMEMARRLQQNRKLHDIAKMIGRIKRMAVGEWSRRVIHGVDEVYDVTIGRDLGRTLASELTLLAEPEIEDIFWIKFLEGTLLNYELRGTEKANRGPIIVLLDGSGSMMGEREIWSKGVAGALLEIAHREHRDFYGIHFGSAGWQGRPPELLEWHFPKGEVDLSKVLDFYEFFFNGGTDFEAPISRGVEVLEKHYSEDGAIKGDLFMITDGECQVSPEWLTRFLNAKHELDFKLYGMLIGYSGHVLNQLSDKMFTIRDLITGGDVKEVFTLI
jgi:uncharacterized protein with von Willebrand factor type A (vWA) domain